MKPLQHVHYLRDPGLHGLEMCRVRKSRHRFPNHFHDDVYAIGLMEQGSSYCLGPGKEDALVSSGKLALINPGQVHSGVPADKSQLTYTMFYCDTELIKKVAGDLTEGNPRLPEFTKTVVSDRPLFIQLKKLGMAVGLPGDRMEKESLLTETFSRLLCLHGGLRSSAQTTGNERRAIRHARRLLSEEIDRNISLEHAAESVGMSRFHFLRTFKKATGIPPHVYRTVKRIEAAKSFIKEGMPLSQVALDTGFSDQSHFTNTFRSYAGASPKQYLSGS